MSTVSAYLTLLFPEVSNLLMGLLTVSSPPHMILAAHLLLLQVSLPPSQHVDLSFSFFLEIAVESADLG